MDIVGSGQLWVAAASTRQQFQQVGKTGGLQVLHRMFLDTRGTGQPSALLCRHHHLAELAHLSFQQVLSVGDEGGCLRFIADISDSDLSWILIFRYHKLTLSIGYGQWLALGGIRYGGSDDRVVRILIEYDATHNVLCVNNLQHHHRDDCI